MVSLTCIYLLGSTLQRARSNIVIIISVLYKFSSTYQWFDNVHLSGTVSDTTRRLCSVYDTLFKLFLFALVSTNGFFHICPNMKNTHGSFFTLHQSKLPSVKGTKVLPSPKLFSNAFLHLGCYAKHLQFLSIHDE